MKRIVKWIAAVSAIIVLIIGIGLSMAITEDIPRQAMVEKYATPQSKFMDWGNGDRVHYRDQGKTDGPVLLLIHGSNASLNTWDGWVDELSDEFRVISVDLPGHGLTGAMHNTDYLAADMGDFIIAFCERLKIDTIIYAGNSMGGRIGLDVAFKKPELLKALILISSAGMRPDPDEETVGAFRLTRSALGRQILRHVTPRSIVEDTIRKIVYDPEQFVTPEKIDLYWEFMRMEGSREANIKRFSGYAAQEQIDLPLHQIATPTLIMWGAHDTLIKPKYGQRMHAAITSSTLIIYENAGHLAMEEIAQETAADARGFIAALD